jgi:hypothetical protein
MLSIRNNIKLKEISKKSHIIIGFKSEEILEKLTILLREIKDYDFPKNWRNIPQLVMGDEIS